jgi:hypothetical protein
MNRGLDVVGADTGGIFQGIFQAGGGALDYVKQTQAEGAAAAKASSALAAAIAADSAATNAVAQAMVSAALAKRDSSKAGVAKADQMAATTAVAVQDKAGAAVPAEKQADRVKAAQAAVDAAQVGVEDALRSGGAPQQLTAQARLDAANQTLIKSQGGSVGGGKGGKGGSSGSFFSKTIVGPMKVWMGLVGVVAAVGGVYLWKRK